MKLKNNLDERQEMEMLRIEHFGMWFCFWALLASLVIQALMGVPVSQMAGEWIIFMALCIGIVVACARKGIWDRYLKPTRKTNLTLSIIAGIAVGLIIFAIILRNTEGQMLLAAVGFAVILGLFTAALCYAAVVICAHIVKKREQQLEQTDLDDE